MTNSSMHHRTTTLERTFSASRARVFAAWAKVELRAKWNSPSKDVTIRYTEDDFSEGGRDVALCLAEGQVIAEVVGLYHQIISDERIIYTEIIKTGEGDMLGVSQVSAGFESMGSGTRMTVTLQTVALAGAEVLDDVATGWTSALDQMGRLFEAA